MNARLVLGPIGLGFRGFADTLDDLTRQLRVVTARSSASNFEAFDDVDVMGELHRLQLNERMARWRRAIPVGPVAAAARPVRERAPASPCLPAPWPLQLRAFGAR